MNTLVLVKSWHDDKINSKGKSTLVLQIMSKTLHRNYFLLWQWNKKWGLHTMIINYNIINKIHLC